MAKSTVLILWYTCGYCFSHGINARRDHLLNKITKFDKLITLNWYAVAAHTAFFIVVLVLYLTWKRSQKHAIAQTYRYTLPDTDQLGEEKCNSDPTNTEGGGKCTTSYAYAPPHRIFRFNIIYGVLFFFAFTALAHVFYATDGFGKGTYSNVIAAGWNPFRWIEYGISASVMSILIAYALGVRDGAQLITLALATAAMQANGFVVEGALKKATVNVPVIAGATASGWLLFVALWLPILYNFITLYMDVEGKYKNEIDPDTGKRVQIPGWVWFIIVIQMFHYFRFGLVQAKQISKALKGTPMDFIDVERAYIFLSFTAKLSLAGGLGYGLLFRTRDCPA